MAQHAHQRYILSSCLSHVTQMYYGINIKSGGTPFEKQLKKDLNRVKIGSISITTSQNDPSLSQVLLPDIEETSQDGQGRVVIMDDQVSTGATALMAIRVALDHHIKEDRIEYCCLVATDLGLANIQRAFPKVRVITACLVPYQSFHSAFGSFSERYF